MNRHWVRQLVVFVAVSAMLAAGVAALWLIELAAAAWWTWAGG